MFSDMDSKNFLIGTISPLPRDWRRQRTPFVFFLHSHQCFVGSLLVSLTTATFLAIHLGFFSALFIYVPLVTICIPALTIFDQQLRFGLCATWCAFLFLALAYPSSGCSAYMNPATPLPALPGTGNGTMHMLIRHLGPENVFVSIYESNSHDRTKALLREFQGQLSLGGVRNRVLLDTDGQRREGWQSNGHERVQYMADMRNRALDPLQDGLRGKRFDRIIFFNDVYFDWKSIIRLLATKGGDFDLGCGLDYDGIVLCDTWVIRDSCGQRAKEIWPYFSFDPVAVAALRSEDPIEVATCWNGVAAFDANWFLPPIPPFTIPKDAPLKFRGDTVCPESECFLIGYDMHLRTAPTRPRIYVNPQVSVAYTPQNWLYYGKIKHLTLTRPWRVVWEDWIAHRLFWWVSDHYWLKDEACPFEREDLVVADHCTA
ncbi:capsular associated protein [Mycena pura]|uniref:Capsular associated protein n=1 Tax=Mycena pura TaxID=153505 RepID=A0AAD6VGW0_9AGAR|nr:capsular associated protein [Mycena pura]